SRISMKNMRKSRFFQRDAYIAVDFLEKQAEILRMKDVDPEKADPYAVIMELGEGKSPKQVIFDKPEVEPLNAIKKELESFHDAIVNDTVPPVTINDGYLALDVAHRIIEKLNMNPSNL
ncbi:MAG: gfo/Idh/MocA family oxidoreductase, partial [Bacteroidetes bacterium]